MADQVFAGLVGAIVVEGGPDLGTAEDHVLVVTDTTLGDDGRVAAAGPMDRVAGREGELVLVNGLLRPVLAGAPQRSQRWRLVNATCSRVFDVSLDGQDLVHVATDGVFLPRPVARGRVRLAPGNRADVVVRPRTSPATSTCSPRTSTAAAWEGWAARGWVAREARPAPGPSCSPRCASRGPRPRPHRPRRCCPRRSCHRVPRTGHAC
nr:hypothetical protein [Pseudonocardia sp. AL041005-10]